MSKKGIFIVAAFASALALGGCASNNPNAGDAQVINSYLGVKHSANKRHHKSGYNTSSARKARVKTARAAKKRKNTNAAKKWESSSNKAAKQATWN